jgi:hypothetical protein
MISGVVRKLSGNPYQNKTLWSFQLDSDRTFYNVGEEKPSIVEGQTVSFDGAPGKRAGTFNVKTGTLTVVDEQSIKPSDYKFEPKPYAGGARRSESQMTQSGYWEEKTVRDVVTQKRIEIQAARNAAIELLQAVGVNGNETPEDFINRWVDIFLKNNEDRLSA